MAGKRGGGSAFPVMTTREGGPQAITDIAEGVTIRDYFAAQGDSPTHAELVAEANASTTYDAATDAVTVGQNPAVSFSIWWATISQVRRSLLLAQVRYKHADAMLLVRDQ